MVADKVYEVVPQAGEGSSDAERGEGQGPGQLGGLGDWAKAAQAAAKSVQKNVASTAAQVGEKAKALDISEQAKAWQSDVSKGFGRVAENATSATAAMDERRREAAKLAKDLGSKSTEKLKDAKAIGAAGAKKAQEKAQAAAAGAKGAISTAGQSLQGLSALAMSPAKLAQFGGVFFVGIFLISLSMSFLPTLVIAPQKFSLLFAFGSMTLLSSFAILKGPQAFLSSLIERSKLPFTAAYAVGLVGTLVATIGLRSFILTAVFGVIQAIALLYFLASYVPGGQAILSFCGNCCSKSARAIGGRLMRS